MINRLLLILASLGIIQLKTPAISGLVIPHHDLARPVITESLEKFPSENKYEIIAVLAPNHFRPQGPTFSSTVELADFEIDGQLVQRLGEEISEIVMDRKLLESDHGVVVPMKIMQGKWPDARFVPILISPYYSEEKLEKLAEVLSRGLPEKSLVVASVDFAHDEQMLTAMTNNQESIKAISEFDFAKLRRFGDEHMDSPAAMETLMRTMQKRKTVNWELWQSLHGAMLTDNVLLQGTSYVIGVFR